MRKRGLGPEDLIHKEFGALIRRYEALGKLDCAYWSYDASGEKRTAMTASLLKAKGLNGGKADYLFIKTCDIKGIIIDFYFWIEFKKPKTGRIDFTKPTTPKIWSSAGKQSDTQKAFQEIFKNSSNSKYYIAYSVNEALKILEKEGVIK